MKTTLLAACALFAATAAQAQTTTVKTKTKTPAGATVKTKSPLAATTAPARPAPAPSEEKVAAKAAGLTANMRQALNLTPAQAEKVQLINLNSVRSVEAARLQYRTDLRKLNAYIDDIGQSRLASLKDVLTPEQFARYQRKREEKMGVPNATGNQGNPVPGLPGND